MNSAHQLWSLWVWRVEPSRKVALPFEVVKSTAARFVRQRFGSAGQMRITEDLTSYKFEVRVEGPPAHDPGYVSAMKVLFAQFFVSYFGPGTGVTLIGPRIQSGSRQDGRPPEQLIILPSIPLT